MMRATVDPDRILSEGTLVDRALKQGVREAMIQHIRMGQPAVGWHDGKIVMVSPQELRRIVGISKHSSRTSGRKSRRRSAKRR